MTRSATTETFDPEAYVAELAQHWTGPHPAECLYCFLCRVIDEFGCQGSHEWTRRWCDAQPGPTGWVLGWVRRNGGCCCDCEVVMNTFAPQRRSQRHRELRCASSYGERAEQ